MCLPFELACREPLLSGRIPRGDRLIVVVEGHRFLARRAELFPGRD